MTAQNQGTGEIDGFRVLEFDLPGALLNQVVSMFDHLAPAPLTTALAKEIPNAQGVYQLFHKERLVYVGKTDSEAGLARRLFRHARTIQSRRNLDVADMAFKAVQVLVFSAMDLETALIKHYRKLKSPSVWNGSGFGNADPGRKRDTTALKEDGFDANYPINIDIPLNVNWSNDHAALDVIGRLAAEVPFTIRHEKVSEALDHLTGSSNITLPTLVTVRSVLTNICASLPSGWQATRLSGRVIFYREDVENYPGAEVIARS